MQQIYERITTRSSEPVEYKGIKYRMIFPEKEPTEEEWRAVFLKLYDILFPNEDDLLDEN
jgi:hypothetical protein